TQRTPSALTRQVIVIPQIDRLIEILQRLLLLFYIEIGPTSVIIADERIRCEFKGVIEVLYRLFVLLTIHKAASSKEVYFCSLRFQFNRTLKVSLRSLKALAGSIGIGPIHIIERLVRRKDEQDAKVHNRIFLFQENEQRHQKCGDAC